MKRIVIGIVIGVVAATALFIPVLLNQRREKYASGKHQGYIDGGLDVIRFLDKHFENKTHMSNPPTNIVDTFGFKDRGVIVKETDGVLTLETH